MSNIYGRQVVVPLTNKSGGSVAAGDVVVVDTSNNDAFTTSTAGAFTGLIGVAQETIANNAVGRVLTAGYAALVNVNASVTRGNFGKSHTVAKQATDAGASRVAGAFCQFLTGGTTPDAHLFGLADNTSGAGTGTLTTIEEADGSPTDSAVTKLILPNGTLGIASHIATFTPAMVRIAQTVLGGTATNITFGSIAGTFEQLLIVMTARTDRVNIRDYIDMQFNADTGANYNFGVWDSLPTSGTPGTGQTALRASPIAGASATANKAGTTRILIPGYARTVFQKTVLSEGWDPNSQTSTKDAGEWANTAAITQVLLKPAVGPNFIAGTVATLYGIT